MTILLLARRLCIQPNWASRVASDFILSFSRISTKFTRDFPLLVTLAKLIRHIAPTSISIFAYKYNTLKMEPSYETIDGLKIRYQVSGNGPSTLLLIHGAVGKSKSPVISSPVNLSFHLLSQQQMNTNHGLDNHISTQQVVSTTFTTK